MLISCRDLPEAISQAGRKEDPILVAEGALQAAIEHRINEGLDIPKPSRSRGREKLVGVPLETAAKAALYLVMRERGITKVQLARELNVQEKEIRRMLKPGHATKIPRILDVLRYLGRDMRVELV